jgi:hypothetical protein
MENKTLSHPILQSVKKKLLAKAIENKQLDDKKNKAHWNDVIIDLRTAKEQSDLQRIALFDFGVPSLESILSSGKEVTNA